ncbi:restriction endonuclease subunit S [Maioricimonas sp. JC845]|uniref:restriction endonuclease subunit S n=1 Tax=Maioricimonas sp. JC845 TaxID=3232138 RepID=UPI00345B15CC
MKLGDVCTKIASGATPRGGKESYRKSGISLIRSQNVYNEGFSREGLAFIDAAQAESLSNVIVQAHDVLMNITGESVCRACQVPDDVLPARVNQHVLIIRTKSDVLDPTFLRYYLLSPRVQCELHLLSSNGATRRALTKAMVAQFEVVMPHIQEQRAIASILGTLDDKIELNRRMNRVLEEMARGIFKAWFVDFEPVRAKAAGATGFPGMPQDVFDALPDSFVDSELGPIPKGWEVGVLDEVIDVNPARRLRKGDVAPYLAMADMPTNGHAPDNWEYRKFGSGMRFTNGDTLVARITPCLENGKTAFVDFLPDDTVGWGSTEYIVLRPREPYPDLFAYCLARLARFREFAISNMTGTSGRQRVPASVLSHYLLVRPCKSLLESFGEVVRPLFDAVSANMRENRVLASSRDTLLPKLISGEIAVPAEAVALAD